MQRLTKEEIGFSKRLQKLLGRTFDSIYNHVIIISLAVLSLVVFATILYRYHKAKEDSDAEFQFRVYVKERSTYLVCNQIIIAYLALEISGRLYAHRNAFFRSMLNVWDLSVSIFVIVWGLSPLPAIPGVSLRLPILIFGYRRISQSIRYEVGMNKRRYQDGSFDLDLTFITDRVIAMGLPAQGKEAFYRNPLGEVARFLNTFHRKKYRVVNLCCERDYPSVPTIGMILHFCLEAERFIRKDPANVIAVHCKGGKGRTGLMIGAWLLWSAAVSTAEEALDHFAERRTDDDLAGKPQIITNKCQIRFLQIIEEICTLHANTLPSPSTVVSLRVATISGLPEELVENNGANLWIVVRGADPDRSERDPLADLFEGKDRKSWFADPSPRRIGVNADEEGLRDVTVDSRTHGTAEGFILTDDDDDEAGARRGSAAAAALARAVGVVTKLRSRLREKRLSQTDSSSAGVDQAEPKSRTVGEDPEERQAALGIGGEEEEKAPLRLSDDSESEAGEDYAQDADANASFRGALTWKPEENPKEKSARRDSKCTNATSKSRRDSTCTNATAKSRRESTCTNASGSSSSSSSSSSATGRTTFGPVRFCREITLEVHCSKLPEMKKLKKLRTISGTIRDLLGLRKNKQEQNEATETGKGKGPEGEDVEAQLQRGEAVGEEAGEETMLFSVCLHADFLDSSNVCQKSVAPAADEDAAKALKLLPSSGSTTLWLHASEDLDIRAPKGLLDLRNVGLEIKFDRQKS
uniref:Uncharacterized protein n=1 Tax=Chromera velia CCMP2878 TaxID=1169474 RepID=A0A0G4HA53_9ALVE|eukprot:Cvel_25446.t1-p1 / transcript=Cvel_25446.t1 / gene=Cvel_25446 / organism=Chromera_velia_CCMP2878 / gene_product=Phosphatidylinositol 3,4,5-trisphosphate, putative / transcript_product=Phosphatidylinositol 3,4,5-trisphosphate, putative / location=Cvel_scaffold2884:12600-20294(-) / protein_length=751 / sequence_SO=supercontig / SO=protein_coding / is_pseudo=false